MPIVTALILSALAFATGLVIGLSRRAPDRLVVIDVDQGLYRPNRWRN